MLENKFIRTLLCFLLMVSVHGSIHVLCSWFYNGSTHVHGSTRGLSCGFYP